MGSVNSGSIRKESVKVLARIVAFVFYYILLIALGALIFVAAFFLSKYLIIYLFPEIHSGRLIVLLALVILGIWCLAGMFGLYLIKPLFSFKKNENPERVEVTQADCPELFAIIYDLADSVKCKRPKHVYLTTDVNACVFYDTSFWSIIFPVRKNLEIGLGLFEGTSTEELKSILAHEFGHFSQNSMKVGSTVYVTNSVLTDLIYGEDWWDRLLNKWQCSDTSVFRWFGNITRSLTNGIKKLNVNMYRFVQKAYLKLSRQMEFDADNISCSIVGRKTFISAMCKIDILSSKDNAFRDYVNALLNDGKLVRNYFSARRVADKLYPDANVPSLSFDEPLVEPVKDNGFPSRVEIRNVWASHPSLRDRLANAAESGHSSAAYEPVPSWSLVPSDIQDKVSDRIFSVVSKDSDNPCQIIDDEEFASFVHHYLEENCIPVELRPYLARVILKFDKEHLPEVSSSPFSEGNARLLSEYETAKSDLQLMEGVLDGSISARELSYNGVVYPKKHIPIDAHKEYVEELTNKVRDIDASIYKYLLDTLSGSDRDLVIRAYDSMFYAMEKLQELREMENDRDACFQALTAPVHRDENDYRNLCIYVSGFEQKVRGLIKKFDWDLLRLEVGEDLEQQMLSYAQTTHNSTATIDTDEVNNLFKLVDILVNMHSSLYGAARKTLARLIAEVM